MSLLERAMLLVAGLVLVYPGTTANIIGYSIVAVVVASQFLWRSRVKPA